MNNYSKIFVAFSLLASPALTPVMAQHASAMHGDHNAHHGGAVDMYDTVHYEVVLGPTGGVRVYFTDEMRNELPASAVSKVRAEIVRPKMAIEPVAMGINSTGEFWQGRSRSVTDPKSVVRIGFVLKGEPALVELSGDAWPSLGKPVAKKAAVASKMGAAGKHDGH